MITLAVVLGGLWLLVVVPYAIRDSRRPYTRGPIARAPGGAGDELVVRHIHEVHVTHHHLVEHTYDHRVTVEHRAVAPPPVALPPVRPTIVEGSVVPPRLGARR